jgi:hypothetical protein
MIVVIKVCLFICLTKVAKLLYFITMLPQNSYNTLTVNRLNNYAFQIINYRLLPLSLRKFSNIISKS